VLTVNLTVSPTDTVATSGLTVGPDTVQAVAGRDGACSMDLPQARAAMQTLNGIKR